jgi:TRAP-type mannitol/chloroaromatic compound transport system permease small subunit
MAGTGETSGGLDKVESASGHGEGLSFPQTRLSSVIEAFLNAVGRVINWLWFLLVLIIVVNVTMRYLVGVNYIWVEEIQWHIYAVGFMIGIGYAIIHDGHVRVDVIAATLRPRTRARIEFLGLVFLVMPLIVLMIMYAIPFVEASWNRNETSSAPGGLSHRWAIKSVIVLAFAFMGLATIARLSRVWAYLSSARAQARAS